MSTIHPYHSSLLPERKLRLQNAPAEKTAAQIRDTLQRALEKPSSTAQPAASQQRKDAAKARIMELKQRLDLMQRFSGLGKANPQQVAQLARELKNLVARYAGLDGGSSPLGMTATPMPADSNSTVTDNTAAATASAEQAAANVATPDTTASKTEADQDEDAADNTPNPNDVPANSPQQANSSNRADQDFFSEAKTLARRIKAMLQQENRQLHNEAEQKKFRQAREAILEMDKMLRDAESAVAADSQPVVSSTPYDASGAANPEVISSGSVSVYA